MNKIKNNLSKIASVCIAALYLSGCSGVNIPSDYKKPDEQYAYDQQKNSSWSQNAPITLKQTNVGEKIKRKNGIPASVYNKKISISMNGEISIKDLMVGISKKTGIPTIISNEEVGENGVLVPEFSGKLGDLLSSIEKTKNVSFSWASGVLVLDLDSQYIVSLPQDKDLLDDVAKELSKLGAKEIQSSVNAGLISYKTSSSDQDGINEYLERLSKNAALITVQVMIINVKLDKDRKTGFDWSSFQMRLGDVGLYKTETDAANNLNNTNGGNGNNSGNGNNNGAAGVLADAVTEGTYGSLTGNGLGFRALSSAVDITGLFNLLSTYGQTKTTQDTSLKAISGSEVKIVSGQVVPYVSNINVATTGGSYDGALGGVQTSKEETGINLKMFPYYEADTKLVTIKIDLSLKSILAFVKLSAGNQIGSLTQPSTQKQEFNSTVRVPVGDSVILGGITYESVEDNRDSLSEFEEMDIASQKLKVSNNSVFVLLRPTVVIYKDNK